MAIVFVYLLRTYKPMTKYWIAVASAEHVRFGQAQGFMQVCHGKGGPLRRLQAGDIVVYYSPVEVFGSKLACQAFTAIGAVLPRPPYQVTMLIEDTIPFHPFRRDVQWFASDTYPIKPLLNQLEFSKGRANWAYPLRFGLVEISEADMRLIAQAMQVNELDVGSRSIVSRPQASFAFD